MNVRSKDKRNFTKTWILKKIILVEKKRKNRYKLNLLSMLKIQLDGKIYIYIRIYNILN